MNNTATTGERPGVFTRYDVTSLAAGGTAPKAAGLVAMAGTATAEPGQPVRATRLSDVTAAFGADTDGIVLVQMASVLFQNGAGRLYIIAPASDSTADYEAAIAMLEESDDIGVVLTDSTDSAVQGALVASVTRCSAARKERLAVIAVPDETAAKNTAGSINSERVLLCCQSGTANGITAPQYLAAATAALIAGTSDPAAPFSGRAIAGIEGVSPAVDDTAINDLVPAGITLFEMAGGRCEIIRAVTTRTVTGGVPDRTYLEVNTILVIDHVLRGIRQSLRARLSGLKNNTATRSAIATQAQIELESNRVAAIIDGYEPPRVYAADGDPTACVVELGFTVVSGLNQIHIAAHIKV